MTEENQEKIEEQMELEYYNKHAKSSHTIISIGVVLFAIFISLFLEKSAVLEGDAKTGLLTTAILTMLAVIPISLKLYKVKFEKAPDGDVTEKIQYISKLQIFRLCANVAVTFFLAMTYALTLETSVIYCELISAIVVVFFCRPDMLEIAE